MHGGKEGTVQETDVSWISGSWPCVADIGCQLVTFRKHHFLFKKETNVHLRHTLRKFVAAIINLSANSSVLPFAVQVQYTAN